MVSEFLLLLLKAGGQSVALWEWGGVWRSQSPAHLGGSQEEEEAAIQDEGQAAAFEGLLWTGQPALCQATLSQAPGASRMRKGTKGDGFSRELSRELDGLAWEYRLSHV